MTESFTISSNRLILKSLSPEHSKSILNYRKDPIANQYQGWIPKTIKDVHEFINTRVSPTINVYDTWHQLVIIKKEDDQIIGDIGLHFLDQDSKQVEIGFTLDKNYQGKGYATEAITATIDYLFNDLNKHRIIASIDPKNTKSIALIERLGFRKEAYFKESILIDGEWVDDVVYAILKSEWTTD